MSKQHEIDALNNVIGELAALEFLYKGWCKKVCRHDQLHTAQWQTYKALEYYEHRLAQLMDVTEHSDDVGVIDKDQRDTKTSNKPD